MNFKKGIKKRPKIFYIKGYVTNYKDHYIGICLTLNLVTTGQTPDKAYNKLHKLVNWYIKDAIKNNEINSFIPRYAPLNYWIEYYKLRILVFFHLTVKQLRLFIETIPSTCYA